MVRWYRKKPARWVLAVGLGVLAGLFFWRLIPSRGPEAPGAQAAHATPAASGSAGVAGNAAALRYGAAFQQGAWDDIVGMTCWMQQRLLRVQIEAGETASRDAVRGQLRERVSDRRVEGNRLRAEGVEDQYVFAAGATLEPIGADAGRDNLESATRDRTWIRVTYPSRREALRDGKGIPIRSIVVGVNVSPEGLVLKANVVGNLDINWESISYDWDRQSGSPGG